MSIDCSYFDSSESEGDLSTRKNSLDILENSEDLIETREDLGENSDCVSENSGSLMEHSLGMMDNSEREPNTTENSVYQSLETLLSPKVNKAGCLKFIIYDIIFLREKYLMVHYIGRFQHGLNICIIYTAELESAGYNFFAEKVSHGSLYR